MAEIWAAAIVTAGVGAYGAYSSSQAEGEEEGIAGQQALIAQQTWNAQQGYQAQLQQLISNPSSVTSLPGYQFQLSEGSAAVASQMAASGFLGSGNEAEALMSYGQGLASSFYGQQTSLLASLSGLQASASTAQSGSAATGAANAATGAAAATTGQANSALGQLGLLYGLSENSNAGTIPGLSPGGGGYVVGPGGYLEAMPGPA